MASFNWATFAGNLTKDPKMREAGDKDVCGFRIAVNNPRKRDAEAMFVSVSVWGKAADACNKHLSKGDGVLVAGPISLRTWESDGGTRTDLEIDAREVTFLGKARGGGDREDRDDGGRSREGERSRSRESYERDRGADRGRRDPDRGRGRAEPADEDGIPF